MRLEKRCGQYKDSMGEVRWSFHCLRLQKDLGLWSRAHVLCVLNTEETRSLNWSLSQDAIISCFPCTGVYIILIVKTVGVSGVPSEGLRRVAYNCKVSGLIPAVGCHLPPSSCIVPYVFLLSLSNKGKVPKKTAHCQRYIMELEIGNWCSQKIKVMKTETEIKVRKMKVEKMKTKCCQKMKDR